MKVLLFALAIVGLSTAAQSQTSPFDNYLRIVNKKLTILQDIGCITVMELFKMTELVNQCKRMDVEQENKNDAEKCIKEANHRVSTNCPEKLKLIFHLSELQDINPILESVNCMDAVHARVIQVKTKNCKGIKNLDDKELCVNDVSAYVRLFFDNCRAPLPFNPFDEN